ncbi:MAG: nucleotidyltransferase domain-containing protein [Candidatus Altiarchaeota archaeon]|nr:nucleotidyltransferase domain-containing protein [Candidatus Altiarchaeota archaeon]
MNQETNEVMDKLSRFFRGQKEVRVAYLFGSVASGKTGPLSDVDVGVFLDESLSKKKRFMLNLRLISEISGILKTDRVDIVIMNDVPVSLNYEIIKSNQPVYTRDESERVDIEHGILSKYLDRRYYDKRGADVFIKKVADRGLSWT